MKRFSVILLILIAISMVFVSCNSEAASNSSDVAKVAVGLGSSKALSATYVADSLPSANELVWKYTAYKNDDGFRTGATTVQTAIRTDNGGNGLPLVIGQTGGTTLENVTSNTWFSTGNWLFNFYGYKVIDNESVLVYEAEEVAVTVNPAIQNDNIGGTANITLSIHTDPRIDCVVKMNPITVDFGNGYVANAGYTMHVYDNGTELTGLSIDSSSSGNTVTFTNTTTSNQLTSYTNLGGLHLLEFKVTKGNDTTVYASGEVFIFARKGYTWTISGDLASLESVAQVGINTEVTYPADTAQSNNTLTVANEGELRAFAAYVNQGNTCEGMTIELTQNITLTSAWTPIGNGYRTNATIVGNVFKGSFDGKEYTISGLTDVNGTNVTDVADLVSCDSTKKEYSYGLFGNVQNASIVNVNLTNVDIKSNNTGYTADQVGALIGFSLGSLTVDNVTVSGTISGESAAGIIGRAYGYTENAVISIKNCTNNATVIGTKSPAVNNNTYSGRAAGIISYVHGRTGYAGASETTSVLIDNCTNNGSISVNGASPILAGIANYGFETDGNDSLTITNNTNTGNLSYTYTGERRVASVAFGCSEPKSDGDVFNTSENSSTGVVTVYHGTEQDTSAVPVIGGTI